METIKIWVPANELNKINETTPPSQFYYQLMVGGNLAEITITPQTLQNWQSAKSLKEFPQHNTKKQMLFG